MISFLQYNQHREFLRHALLVCGIYHTTHNCAYILISLEPMPDALLWLMFLCLEESYYSL